MNHKQGAILAATDGTERSRAVLGRAALLAQDLGRAVALVHVRERPSRRFQTAQDVSHSEMAAQLLAHGANLRDLHILDGVPTEEIPKLAQHLGAGLLVLGLHRERRVLDLLGLTTMERLTQDVCCPVLIAQRFPAQPYQRVLGAVTFTPACATGLALAAKLAPQAQIQAIHAVQLPLKAKLGDPDTTLARVESARAAFMKHADRPDRLGVPETVVGGVHEVLRYRIREWKPDLLVIGSQSERAPDRLGNYTRDLIRAPSTDVLITKPDFNQTAAG